MRSLVAISFIGAGFIVACTTFDGLKADGTGNDASAATDSSKVAKPVECGTATTKACGGSECKADTDCASQKCEAGKCTAPIALPPSASDGIKNNGETDVDCGGPNAEKCADGKTCAAASDCVDGVCGGGTCKAPTGTDKVKNGDETDVDCGGTTTGAPKCAAGKSCIAHSDCASDGCDDTNHCALARSCTKADGGRTCGAGEVEDPTHKHESCCTSLPLPSGVKLDKYEITAGRMRAFIERTKGDVQGWYNSAKAGLSAKQRASIDPFVDKLPVDMDGDPTAGPGGAKFQVGAFVYLTDRPSTEQGCYTGNASDQAFGAHTYFTSKADENEDRAFDQAFLDRLPLNCVPYPMVAAFCLWDGGWLQTAEENDEAYGSGIYPWGNAPAAAGFENTDFAQVGPGGITPGVTFGKTASGDTTLMNWSNVYQHPQGDSGKPWDLANFIAPPGRFTKDVGALGHMDLGANLMEWTSSDARPINGDSGVDPEYGPKKRWSRSGSWEGHQANNVNWQFAVMTKYGKTGGRCARDN